MAAVTDEFQEQSFRPAFGRAAAAAMIVVCASAALSVVGAGLDVVVSIWPWLALLGYAAWALYWRPEVRIDPAGVHVVNVFRTFDVPWPAIEQIETQWALTLVTRWGTVKAWAAPAPGRQAMRRAQPGDRRIGGARPGDTVRPSDLPNTESGAAAMIVRQRWVRLREAGHLDDDRFDGRIEFERMPTRWHLGTICGFVALIALVAVGTATS